MRKVLFEMNTLANSLFRVSLRSSVLYNKPVVTHLSQLAHENAPARKRRPISKAMRAYIERVKDFEQRTIIASAEYDAGKRFLANIMGEDPATFTHQDVDRAVEYLLPSGIYQKWCRPEMKPPQDVIETSKFDDTGRPFNYLFYTAAPHMFELQHEVVKRINKADKLLEQVHGKGHTPEKEQKVDLLTSEWVDRMTMSKIINEQISPAHFEKTIEVLEKLADHPLSGQFEDFLMTYRKPVVVQLTEMEFPKVEQDADGRFFVQSTQTKKTAKATVIVHTQGEGRIVINGEYDLQHYFSNVQSRQQVLYPLQLTGLLGKVDLDIAVEGGGFSGQSGAIRHATSMALAGLVDEDMRAKLQMAGLLTWERRSRERKKFGKRRARRGYTWLKR